MASGIDGPGFDDPNFQNVHKIGANEAEDTVQSGNYLRPFGNDTSYLPAAVPMLEAPAVLVTEPTEGHLSFSNLMHLQTEDLSIPESAIRRASSASATPIDASMQSQFARAQSRKPNSIVDDIEKVFDTGAGTSAAYPEPLKFDFGDPDIASEVSTYNEQRFTDDDYDSHRRTQRHHSKPLSSHLSSHEMKSVKSRAAVPKEDKEAKKSRRRHRSSSSSSSHGSGSRSRSKSGETTPVERKIKKKEKKTKPVVRKSLTANVRQRTLSIPEEEENDEEFIRGLDEEIAEEEESEEEEEEDEEEDSGRDRDDSSEERPDDDKGGDSNFRRHSEGDASDGDSAHKDREVQPHDGKAGDVIDIGNEGMRAKFSVGDEVEPRVDLLPVPTVKIVGPSDKEETDERIGGFYVGSSEDLTRRRSANDADTKPLKEKERKRRRHSHQKKKISNLHRRRASGQQLRDLDEAQRLRTKLPSEDLDDKTQAEEIRSHRFGDHAGIRKHLLHRPVKKRRERDFMADPRVKTDHKPHEVFVELDELVGGEWKETARWIKFEEDVEESQRWGKPRVASLSFHSLLELRRTIEKGAVILDLPSDNLTDIANAVVEQMVQSDQIKPEDKGSVLKVLLSKHKHLPGQHGLAYSLSQANFSSFFAASNNAISKMEIENEETSASYSNAQMLEPKIPLLDLESNTDVERGREGLSRVTSPSTRDLKIMRKIPRDAEATAVLVGSVDYLDQPTMAFVRLSAAVELDNVVALPIPVRFIFVLLGPKKEDFDYHEIGRSISTLMSDEEFHVVAYQAETRGDLLRAINEFLDDSIVLPPGQLENPELLKNIARYQKNLAQRTKKRQMKALSEKGPTPPPPPEDPLQRTRRCFGGLVRDVKRRYPLYLTDIRDGLNAQCLATFIFIYFAALSPAITFGGLLGEKTGGLMGVSEMVVGCCACGCLMALFSGQPMLIVGATGPLLVFEEAVYAFCGGNNLPFLATRVWIGMWISMIAIITVAFEGSFLIRFVSRFTQEIFSFLIALIFIYETFNKLFKIYDEHPLEEYYPVPGIYNGTGNESGINCTWIEGPNGTTTPEIRKDLNQPNTALLSTLLMFGTFFIAMMLRSFRNSKFLRSSVRRTIGDFGVPIAIFLMVLLDFLIKDTYTQKLNIPKGFEPTNATARNWLISPLGDAEQPMPIWMIFASALPAFLVFILIFMESHITELIVSKKERCLKKGTGFHLNILVLGLLNCLVSFFGMPWVCAAAVRSITHTNSLTVMSKTQAPGEKPKIEATLEQRVTCFLVNAALGLSILMQPVLKEIPIAVLFGIFLYMGVTSLTGVQFVDRILLLFMPAKHHPDYDYVKTVRPFRIHMFTIIEFACLIVLWVVKSTPASIAFPFFLLLTIPLRRYLLPKIFEQKELAELDNDGSSNVESKDDFDDAEAHSPD